jgi:hypothetical protein
MNAVILVPLSSQTDEKNLRRPNMSTEHASKNQIKNRQKSTLSVRLESGTKMTAIIDLLNKSDVREARLSVRAEILASQFLSRVYLGARRQSCFAHVTFTSKSMITVILVPLSSRTDI